MDAGNVSKLFLEPAGQLAVAFLYFADSHLFDKADRLHEGGLEWDAG